jgi:quercetin dioxygenase-like cupin family protein
VKRDTAVRKWTRVGPMISALLALSIDAPPARAQDPLKTLPDNYRLEFENDLVKVVHVVYPPHAKLPAHAHPQGSTAFVYLTDGPPVVFGHIGLEYGAITRPPTVAGAVRLGRAVDEIHEVENPGDTPSEFLRVEFKAIPPTGFRGRFAPESGPAGEHFAKVHFENDHLRVTRRTCAPEQPCDIAPGGSEAALVVALRPARLAPLAGGPAHVLERGRTLWLESGAAHDFRNPDAVPAELMVFALKAPAASGSPRP